MSWPKKWGFLTDPKNWTGKTVVSVEVLRMEFGCTHSESTAILFSDGSRGWILGGNSSNCSPSPNEQSISKSTIITPEEYGEYQADKLRKHQQRILEEQRRKRHDLERLKIELGEI